MDTEYALEVDSLCKSFAGNNGHRVVLDNFSCRFKKEKITFLTAPNGEGKTVLAKCILGIIPFDRGSVTIFGRQYNRLTRRETCMAGCGYVPQRLLRPQRMTAHEFLSIDHANAGLIYSKSRLTRLLSQLKDSNGFALEHDLNHRIADLNTSQLQRLYIAKSLIARDKILLFDEPTAYLSFEDSRQLAITMKSLTNAGVTIVAISHPDQFMISDAEVAHFTSRGLKNPAQILRRSFTKAEGDCRFWPVSESCIEIKTNKGQVKIVKGSVVSITGNSSKEFNSFSKDMQNIPNQWISMGSSAWPIIAYLPHGVIEETIAKHLDLLENCLVGHWDDRRWNTFGIIHSSLARKHLVEPILQELHIAAQDGGRTHADKLSDGNLQRLAIGRACYNSPDIMVAQGLFRGLDDAGIDLVIALLYRRAQKGMTSILLSTSAGTERQICDHSYRFERGELVAE